MDVFVVSDITRSSISAAEREWPPLRSWLGVRRQCRVVERRPAFDVLVWPGSDAPVWVWTVRLKMTVIDMEWLSCKSHLASPAAHGGSWSNKVMVVHGWRVNSGDTGQDEST